MSAPEEIPADDFKAVTMDFPRWPGELVPSPAMPYPSCSLLVTRFMAAFSGLPRAHGVYELPAEPVKEGVKVKGRAFTKQEPVTEQLWTDHLNGVRGLGIVPIRDDAMCWFGGIDIDKHDIDLIALEKDIARLGLPLVVCRSKSGGAHPYLFGKELIPAAVLQKYLSEWAALLGYPKAEIFPKQTSLDPTKDIGNWINMPYFDHTKTNRYCVHKGKPVDAEKFLDLAEKRRVTIEQLALADEIALRQHKEDATASNTASERIRHNQTIEGQRHNDLKTWLVGRRKMGLSIEEIATLAKERAAELWAEAEHEGLKEAAAIIKWIEHKISPTDDPHEPGITPKERIKRIRKKRGSVRDKRAEISRVVIEYLRESGQFYRTILNELYYFDNAKAQLSGVESPELRARINDRFDINGSEPDWKFVIEDIRAEALLRGKLTTVHHSFHYDRKANQHYSYAGDNRVLLTGASGTREVPNGTDGVLFLNADMASVRLPENRVTRGAVGRALWRLLRVPRFQGAQNLRPAEERKLYAIFVVALLFVSLLPTKPLLLLHGPKGSGKTSALKALLRALFGPLSNVFTLNRTKEDAFLAVITNSYFVGLDNVDGYVPWLADHLAVAATGGTVPLRQLYETNKLVQFPIHCFIAMTSREPKSFTRDDIADRLLVLSVDRFERFVPESELFAEIDRLRPEIWAELLGIVQRVVEALADHKPGRSAHRLADFADLALVIGPVLGMRKERVREMLDAMDAEKAEFALEHNNLAQALVKWMNACAEGKQEAKQGLTGDGLISTGDLFNAMRAVWEGDKFPVVNAISLGKRLPKSRADFASLITIEEAPGPHNTTRWRITPGPKFGERTQEPRGGGVQETWRAELKESDKNDEEEPF